MSLEQLLSAMQRRGEADYWIGSVSKPMSILFLEKMVWLGREISEIAACVYLNMPCMITFLKKKAVL